MTGFVGLLLFLKHIYKGVFMDYFKQRENVDLYTSMMDGYDNSFVISQVESLLPPNSTLLELGMGTGLDLIALSEKYRVVGSDYSRFFVEDFKLKSDLEVLVLDAINIDIAQKFDCIYSNKVLQHLSKDEFIASLRSQYEHLNKDGIIFLTLWHGVYREEFELDGQLRFVYYDKKTIENIIPKQLKIETVILYSEFDYNDSMIIVLRPR